MNAFDQLPRMPLLFLSGSLLCCPFRHLSRFIVFSHDFPIFSLVHCEKQRKGRKLKEKSGKLASPCCSRARFSLGVSYKTSSKYPSSCSSSTKSPSSSLGSNMCVCTVLLQNMVFFFFCGMISDNQKFGSFLEIFGQEFGVGPSREVL